MSLDGAQRPVAGEADSDLARDPARQPDAIAAVPVGDDLGELCPFPARESPRLDRDARVRQQRAARSQHAAQPRPLAIPDADLGAGAPRTFRAARERCTERGVAAQREVEDHLAPVFPQARGGAVADGVRGGGPQLVRAALELLVGNRGDEVGALATRLERAPLGDAALPDLDQPAGDAAVPVGRLDPNLRRRAALVEEGE